MSESYTEQTGEAGKCAAWFRAIANGNAQAEAWLWAFWNFSQVLDDLVDGDRKVPQPMVAQALADWWTACSMNAWFATHANLLWLPGMQAIERWQTADEWAAGRNSERRQDAKVLRHGDLEVCLAVAQVCGGWQHALRCRELRTWDEEDKAESRKQKADCPRCGRELGSNEYCEHCRQVHEVKKG